MSRRRRGERLSSGHWQNENFKQRVTWRVWQKILKHDELQIYVDGKVVNLIGKDMGDGFVEIGRDK